ncbi:MAG TPA: geranylgeranyl reductase family protein [Bacteroidetes bacterium]|nr:geranylgeranyl reductase family protein [Bacteroidota bacterium]
MKPDYDIIIIGAGPAGSCCAMYCARHGLKTLLVDKARFPRDKTCGDAISGSSVDILDELGLTAAITALPHARVDAVLFSAPNGMAVTIPFTPRNSERQYYGYVCRRMDFDAMLFRAAAQQVETRENFTVKKILTESGRVCGISDGSREVTAKVVVGADGFKSVLARAMQLYHHDPAHLIVATRGYYSGISGLRDVIEIHFVEDVLPGYFWIFPLGDGMANVGIGMMHNALKAHGISLHKAHIAATESAFFRQRFSGAKLLGNIHGWNLPIGSKRRRVHGDGFVLIGDAAGLIDPSSGEGISNAMQSGKIAAEVLAEVCAHGEAGANQLAEYERRLWHRLGPGLNSSTQLQKHVFSRKPLLNFLVKRAVRNPDVRDLFSQMMVGDIDRGAMANPMMWLRLLWK